ncbi:hypothetical protein [Tenacibaculum maritimum]|uniref:hypothetical protein n=2 Tax=Tenacibaculum maritimum TaxID=107401 RepID=UPI0012E5E8F2|nr:hypothetical protein [Tenacibaculum maritimum]MCD9564282.1 hypothetical protein [Tenacibaculum maritimum]MCD9567104.1 hypothetical protein [Tenacibaculum maritimum]MCD9580319.1 hypothetical protein [Tenacibaculum maritimum]MCD9598078.1 hypothetical protein [Tenacibaculum maritimum]MCD9612163.1 hypothetical protein [Tenacibaculum maritimum]
MTNEERIAQNEHYEIAKKWMRENGTYLVHNNITDQTTTVSFQKDGEEIIESMTGERVDMTIRLYNYVRE